MPHPFRLIGFVTTLFCATICVPSLQAQPADRSDTPQSAATPQPTETPEVSPPDVLVPEPTPEPLMEMAPADVGPEVPPSPPSLSNPPLPSGAEAPGSAKPQLAINWTGSVGIGNMGANQVITGTTKTVIVGQRISLKGVVSPASSGATLSSYSWVITGNRIGGYRVDLNAGRPINMPPLSRQNIAFYWHQSGTYTATFRGEINKASAPSVTVTFVVVKPKVNFFSGTRTTDVPPVDIRNGGSKLRFGHLDLPGAGIRWNASVKTNLKGAGKIAFFQLGFLNRAQTLQSGQQQVSKANGKLMLDDNGHDVAYGNVKIPIGDNATGGIASDDTPDKGLAANLKTASASDGFQTFLMYRSDAPDSIWVPLSRLTWSWSGSAQRYATQQYPATQGWKRLSGNPDRKATDPVLPPLFGATYSQLPRWNGRINPLLNVWVKK